MNIAACKKKVMVAMSGGLDSSMAALLLQQAGYEIIGVTMVLFPDDISLPAGDRDCGYSNAVEDARRVCGMLGIPFHVLNFCELFGQKVVDYFVSSYLQGKTPNPCIVCNRQLKFGALLEKAKTLGMDYLATGHYARCWYDSQRGRYLLAKGLDANKDQSYALFSLTQGQLAHILLPLGDYTKEQIRSLAVRYNLPVAQKSESQDICFIPDGDYRQYLQTKVPGGIRPGPIVDKEGRILGEHRGLPFYTVGQRKGLGLAMGKPYFVVALDSQRNAVIVGPREDLQRQTLYAGDNNYILWRELPSKARIKAKIRYRAPEALATWEPLPQGRAQLEFDEPQRAITPGQAVVYYQDDLVVGGGIIEPV